MTGKSETWVVSPSGRSEKLGKWFEKQPDMMDVKVETKASIDKTFNEVRELLDKKGAEYACDADRLAHFKRNGEKLGLLPEQIWAVFAGKHIDAVFQYIKDLSDGTKRDRLETIDGRINDIIAYLVLFKMMVEEREDEDSGTDSKR